MGQRFAWDDQGMQNQLCENPVEKHSPVRSFLENKVPQKKKKLEREMQV